jgi:hypothetical protein
MLKDNPATEAEKKRHQELLALRSENEALRKQTSSTTGYSMPSESTQILELKISELQSELLGKEKRMMRLKEVLNARVQEFRESICAILGYKVDLQPHGTIKFASIYAPSRIFEFDTKGNLVHAGNMSDLKQGMEAYLERSHVPAFMSWMTLHFFETPMEL